LTFGRWVKQAPYSPYCGVMARLPQALRMTELPAAEQFAAVELFRGTMVRHSVIVYRDDSPSPFQPVSFAGDAWLSYVPIRMSETICVQERLPAGAAGVLLNRNHTYTDLLMTIDAAEKHMFDATDGNRTIDQISETTLPSSRKQRQLNACTFFERLWWHDQVVFDTSKSG
jgi:hypothetical protein